MNESDRPNENNDPQISDALHRLPTPDHKPSFWAELDAQVAAEPNQETTAMTTPNEPHAPNIEPAPTSDYANVTDLESRRPTGLIAGLLGAAAVLLIGLVVGITTLNNDDDEVDTGPATPGSVIPETTGSVAPTNAPATTVVVDDTSTVTAVPATVEPTTTPPPTVAPASNIPDGFTVAGASELFQFDVLGAPEWQPDPVSSRTINVGVPGEPFAGGLMVDAYFPGDEPDDAVTFYVGDSPILDDETIEVPLWVLFDDSGPEVLPQTVSARQITVDPNFRDHYVMRIIELGDRTIIASLSYDGAIPGGWTEDQILDGVRIQDSGGGVAPSTSCSAAGMTPPATPTELNADQAARFGAIVTAVTACDWDAIESQISTTGFTASFGGDEAIDLWQNDERYGGTIMRTLIEHMSVPVTITESDGTAAWPRATNIIDWTDVDQAILDELESLGYDPDPTQFEDIGYLGYRTGIDIDGEWTFFVAGD